MSAGLTCRNSWWAELFCRSFPGGNLIKPVAVDLRKWTIRDAADVTTTVTLQNMKFGHSYENKFFAKSIYPDEN